MTVINEGPAVQEPSDMVEMIDDTGLQLVWMVSRAI
jgi:hypothetical protein